MVNVTTELPLLDIIAVILALISLLISVFIGMGIIRIHDHVETIRGKCGANELN